MINNSLKNITHFFKHTHIGVSILLLCVLAMIILPLSPLVLNILFTFNIVLSVLVLLVSVNSKRPLDFAVFPTILLITTLMRLTLNVASTRVVLLHNHEGIGAASKVIEAFGQVVIGGNFVVGFVVFIILMIINFVVVTKRAERISEVSARFTLDTLPGKQMAIDADLNAGLLDQEQARQRRKEIANEADFYGAMDGASKFVRGDAITGIMILIINVIGGVCIGIFKYDLDASQSFQQYVLLTIGDGLVAQIPSLLLATTAAIIVTRVSDGGDMSDEVKDQLLAKPNVLYASAFVMFILAIVPGMPHIAFLSFTALLIFAAWRQGKKIQQVKSEPNIHAITQAISFDEVLNISWDSIPTIEPIALTLGYKLVTLVDKEKGNTLTQRVRGVRQIISETCGILIPEVRIRENFRLKPTQYSININNVKVAEGEVHVNKLMAIPTPELYGEIDGILDNDPSYGIAIVWIDPEEKSQALGLGYQVVDSASVLATHVNKVVRHHLPELFNYDDITPLHERLATLSPRLAEDLATTLNFSQLLRIYRQLLAEQVPLKDIVRIAATLIESAAITKDPMLLTADVRYALRYAIVNELNKGKKDLPVYTINNKLENILLEALNHTQQTSKVALDNFPVDPNILNQLQKNMPIIKEKMKARGGAQILLVAPQIRPIIARYARLFAEGLNVLSYNEIPDNIDLDIVGTLE